MSDEPDLLKPDEVTDSGLQIELGNLRAENEALRQELEKQKYDYSTLVLIDKQLNQENEQLKAENEALKASPPPAPEIDPLELAEWHKQYLAANPKSKATYSDFRKILKILR